MVHAKWGPRGRGGFQGVASPMKEEWDPGRDQSGDCLLPRAWRDSYWIPHTDLLQPGGPSFRLSRPSPCP